MARGRLAEAVFTEIDNHSRRLAEKMFWEVRRECPKRSGRTARSFSIMKINGNYVVGSTKLTAYYADQGNGGRDRLIYPTNAKLLRVTNNVNRTICWKPFVHGYDGAGFLKNIADRHGE